MIAHQATWAFKELGILSTESEMHGIRKAFVFLQSVSLALILWSLVSIAKRFSWSKSQTFALLTFSVINFAFLKVFSYEPFLTDMFSTAVITLFFRFYFYRNIILSFVAYLVALFAHPFAFLLITPLLIFWHDANTSNKSRPTFIFLYNGFWYGFAFLFSAFWVIYFGLWIYDGKQSLYHMLFPTATNWSLWLLSFSVILAILYFSRKFFLPVWKYTVEKLTINKNTFIRLSIVALILIARKYFLNETANHFDQPFTETTAPNYIVEICRIIGMFFHLSVQNPLIAYTTHSQYIGLSVAFILIFRKQLSDVLQKIPPGLTFSAFFILLFTMDNESRRFTSFIPFFAIILMMMFQDKIHFSKRLLLLIFGVNIFLSFIWLPVNQVSRAIYPPFSPVGGEVIWYSFHAPWSGTVYYSITAFLFLLALRLVWHMKKNWPEFQAFRS
ncbi:MAG: hypothetical protein LW884_08805 [Bacteroidetes bacterium]|jgi:hypothetical protein|nr:hypothetical protein [Bacteroidota bacterium]